MSKKTEDFYRTNKLPEALIRSKLARYEQNPDIAKEFEYWIDTKKYKTVDCITIEGFTAQGLSKLSAFLNGDGAFDFLIELRQNPDKAKALLHNGLKKK